MANKTATIRLQYFQRWWRLEDGGKPRTVDAWRVLSITDSLEFNPGAELSRDKVDALCHDKAWKVTITNRD